MGDSIEGNLCLCITTPWNFHAEDLQIGVQLSKDMQQWIDAPDVVKEDSEGFRRFMVPVRDHSWFYFRFQVTSLQ